MKREFEIKKVNSILNNLIENNSLKEGLNNIKIQTIWKKTMGDNINSYTSEITLRKNIRSAFSFIFCYYLHRLSFKD